MRDKIRILLVVRHPVGGIRTFLYYVYRLFDPNNYHFTLIAPEVPEVVALLEDLSNLSIAYVPVAHPVSIIGFFKTVFKTVHHEKFDLIHSHGLTAAACSTLPALFKRLPHILTPHDVVQASQLNGVKGRVRQKILSYILSLTDIIHCVSHDARDNLLRNFAILRSQKRKLKVVPNGIDVARFCNAAKRNLRQELNLDSNTFLIGFLGRFMSQKGFSYLVEALGIILRNYNLPLKPLVLTFGSGDGFYREEMTLIKKKGLGDFVLFLPFEPNIASTLKGLDVVVMPSIWEACPLQPMEAMVAGTPIIGTNCIGLREILKDTPAVMVPMKDANALAVAIVQEMKNPSSRVFQEFAKEAAKRFDVTNRARELEEIILDLLRLKKRVV